MDNDNENSFSSSLLTFAAAMTFIIMIVGIFGNLLTVIALVKCPKVRNVAAAFIISLCLADLIFCLAVLPFSALRYIQGTWTHGDVLCKAIPFIQYGNVGVSLLCIAMITINRYVMIAHHTTYGKIYKKHWIALMIAFCWLFSYGMQLPTLFGIWGKFGYDPKLGTCSIMNDTNGNSSKTTLFILAFVIPCLIIIACYTKIFWVVHESEMRLKKHTNKQNSIPNNLRQVSTAANVENGTNRTPSNVPSESSFSTDLKQESVQKPSRIKDQREVRAKRNEWRITKMVLAIFLSFLICYLPITIVKVADKNVEYLSLHICSYILLYLSACINPIIYVIMNKQYRKAYKTVIMCEPLRLLSCSKNAEEKNTPEMERHGIEHQPQPNNSITNVDGGSTKYQLKWLSNTAHCIRTDNSNEYKPSVRNHRHSLCEHEDKDARNNSIVSTATKQCHHVPKYESKEQAKFTTESEKGNESNSFSGGRYYSRRGGRTNNIGSYRSEQRNDCEHETSEENPILWTKHKRHSR